MKKYQHIRYISGEPGLGKTHWAIGQMLHAIHHTESIVFYIAPTIKLCQQVERDLRKRLRAEGMTEKEADKRTIAIYSQLSGRGSVYNALLSAIEGRPDLSGTRYNRVKKGRVVFMTHQGFFSLPDSVMSEDFKKQVVVYFDEAKKPVFSPAPLKLTSQKAEKLFNRVFNFEPYKETNFKRLTLADNYEVPLKKLRAAVFDRNAKQALTNLVASVSNTRVEVFLSSKRTNKGLQFFQLRLPSRVFEGFQEVTLLSAFFEDSQLYYLLSTDPRIKLNPIGHLMPDYFRGRGRVKERYSHVTIVPLTTQDTVISKTSLYSMLLRGDAMSKVQSKLESLGIQKSDHVPIIRYLNDRHCPDTVEGRQRKAFNFLNRIEGLARNPIRWYMKQAKRVIEAWKEKYEPENTKVDRPLMFVNKMFEDQVDTRYFHQVSTSAHGLNQYRHSNVAVFLAAINPDPQLASFLKARIGDDYDIQRDYVLDACIQSLGRCSVRQSNLRDPILIILPDMKLTKMVQERMSNMPAVNTRVALQLGDMVSFTIRSFNVAKRQKRVSEAGGVTALVKKEQRERSEKWRSDPINKELQKLRSRRSYYAKKLRAHPRDKTSKQMMAQLESEIQHLLARKA